MKDLDISKNNLGRLASLENEAGVQIFIHPITKHIVSLFQNRLTIFPEHLTYGRTDTNGIREFTISFCDRLLLVFIELQNLTGIHSKRSDIVAQVIAETDRANTLNQSKAFEGIPIHAILTDGVNFEFYYVNYQMGTVLRGLGYETEGIACLDENYRISLPAYERSPLYLGQLKIVSEIVLDTVLQCYIHSIEEMQRYSKIRASYLETAIALGYDVYIRENWTKEWDETYGKALMAQSLLREAHCIRTVDPVKADEESEKGLDQLRGSAMSIQPHPELEWSFFDNWEDRKLDLMRV